MAIVEDATLAVAGIGALIGTAALLQGRRAERRTVERSDVIWNVWADDEEITSTRLNIEHAGHDPAFEVTCTAEWMEERREAELPRAEPGDVIKIELPRARYQSQLKIWITPNVRLRVVWRTEGGIWRSHEEVTG